GIRTRDTLFGVYTLSRRAPSTTRPPLRICALRAARRRAQRSVPAAVVSNEACACVSRAGKVTAVRVGSPATTSREPRQARKGAAVAARLGAGVGLARTSFFREKSTA